VSSGSVRPDHVGTGAARPALVLVGLLALAVNLRAALAGYPPLLETIRADLGVGAGAAGLVQAGAVLMMAAGSFAGPMIGTRVGREFGLGGAVGLVALGSLLRGVPALAALVGGSLVIGFGIGLAGVLIAGVVKEHLGHRAGAATGGYTVAMMIGATVASALAVPLATVLGGWSIALAALAVPAVLAVAIWLPIAGRTPRTSGRAVAPAPAPAPPLRRNRFARLITCYQAGTSTMFYGWITWLAPYYEGLGRSPQQAGVLLAAWSMAQLPAALLAPALAERRRRWRFWSSLSLGCGLAGTLGAMVLPELPGLGPWLWPVLIGFGLGSSFPLGLTVIAWRTPDGAASAATTGLALGVGYSCAGVAPLLMGLLIDVTGGFRAALALLLVAGALQGWAIRGIGRS
jgi:MFS transporter, CP family, cyanate transporter